MQTFNLLPGSLTQDELRQIGSQAARVVLPDASWQQVRNSRLHLSWGQSGHGPEVGWPKT